MRTHRATCWLTIPEVCAYLQVSEAEWHQWRAAGQTPLHAAGPDGQLQVRLADLERWLDTLADEPAEELTPEEMAAEIAAELAAGRGQDETPAEPDASGPGVVQLTPRRVARGPGRRVDAVRDLSQWRSGPGDDGRGGAC